MPLPWGDGCGGNSKAELATLAADASPLELGDWLAVCGPVLRDLSSVSARWWNLTLREHNASMRGGRHPHRSSVSRSRQGCLTS